MFALFTKHIGKLVRLCFETKLTVKSTFVHNTNLI